MLNLLHCQQEKIVHPKIYYWSIINIKKSIKPFTFENGKKLSKLEKVGLLFGFIFENYGKFSENIRANF